MGGGRLWTATSGLRAPGGPRGLGTTRESEPEVPARLEHPIEVSAGYLLGAVSQSRHLSCVPFRHPGPTHWNSQFQAPRRIDRDTRGSQRSRPLGRTLCSLWGADLRGADLPPSKSPFRSFFPPGLQSPGPSGVRTWDPVEKPLLLCPHHSGPSLTKAGSCGTHVLPDLPGRVPAGLP